MRTVFISYRHESNAHAAAVRQFAERLRSSPYERDSNDRNIPGLKEQTQLQPVFARSAKAGGGW